MRSSLFLTALLAIAGAASSGEPAAPAKAQPAGAASDAAATGPVLSRLALSQDAARKVSALLAEHEARAAEVLRTPADDAGRAERLGKLAESTRSRMREALDEDRRRRFDAGLSVMADWQTRMLEALRELAKASADAKGDAAKLKAARTACAEKLAAIRADRDRLLDEKVGPRETPTVRPKPQPQPQPKAPPTASTAPAPAPPATPPLLPLPQTMPEKKPAPAPDPRQRP